VNSHGGVGSNGNPLPGFAQLIFLFRVYYLLTARLLRLMAAFSMAKMQA
jgi:hypothetical protein